MALSIEAKERWLGKDIGCNMCDYMTAAQVCGVHTQQGLQGGAALLEPVPGVGRGEEDGCGNASGSLVQAEAHGRQQGLPAWHAAHLILHTLLRRVHGVLLAILDALQGLLHLRAPESSVK